MIASLRVKIMSDKVIEFKLCRKYSNFVIKPTLIVKVFLFDLKFDSETSAESRVDWRENRGFQQILSLLVEVFRINLQSWLKWKKRFPPSPRTS